MSPPQVNSLRIEGFLSIRSATVELGALNVIIGANGAGKSNLVRVFELLGRIVSKDLGLFVGLNGGGAAILNDRSRQIALEVESTAGTYRTGFIVNGTDELIFLFESAMDDGDASGETASGVRETHVLVQPDGELESLFRGCRVFHFNDTSLNAPVKQNVPTADNLALRSDGGNVAAVLMYLRDADPLAYRRIVAAVQQVAPFFRDFVLQPGVSDRVRLRWRQVGSDAVFSAHQMSDGTLRFVCLATLLLQSDRPGLVVLDEPELGLHPLAIMLLADLLRDTADRGQVVVATQSATLLNQFALADVIIAEREDGGSVFRRPDSARLAQWLDDYSLGELWEKNLLGGGPRREKRGLDG